MIKCQVKPHILKSCTCPIMLNHITGSCSASEVNSQTMLSKTRLFACVSLDKATEHQLSEKYFDSEREDVIYFSAILFSL